MKRFLLFLLITFQMWMLGAVAQAQVPQGIPYQAAARNASGQPLVNTAVKVRFSIIDSVATGITVYQETHSVTTNNVGLFNVNVGLGTPITGTFSGISWGQNFKFMKVELDPTGAGSNYVDMGTQQMMSVPYALYAGTSSTVTNVVYSPSNNNLTVGMTYGGGKIAYLLQPYDNGYDPYVQHGLIVPTTDQSTGIKWGCNGINAGAFAASGTYSTIGYGSQYTSIIVNNCGLGTAAKLCDDLILNGFNDWFLPSTGEFILIRKSALLSNLNYWTSTEITTTQADVQGGLPGSGSPGYGTKNSLYAVRAVRSF